MHKVLIAGKFEDYNLCNSMTEQFVTGPAKIVHVGSQNLTTFQTFVTHTFLHQYGMVTQFSEIVHNLTGFPTHLTKPKYYEICLIKFNGSF